MSEAYMTSASASTVSDMLDQLNDYFSPDSWYEVKIKVEADIATREGETLGRVVFSTVENQYVFVPVAYKSYEPVLEGE
jgi:hypothetical protein